MEKGKKKIADDERIERLAVSELLRLISVMNRQINIMSKISISREDADMLQDAFQMAMEKFDRKVKIKRKRRKRADAGKEKV